MGHSTTLTLTACFNPAHAPAPYYRVLHMQMLALEGIKKDLEVECLRLSTSSHQLEAQLEAKTVQLEQAVTAAQADKIIKVRSPHGFEQQLLRSLLLFFGSAL